MPRLLTEFATARLDGRLPRLLAAWARIDVLVLDAFSLQPLTDAHYRIPPRRSPTRGPSPRASDAAVLGQSFTLAGLSAVSGIAEADLEPRLRALVHRELLTLETDPRSPERGQYAFVQALVREVAYNTLTKRERKVRHRSSRVTWPIQVRSVTVAAMD